MTIDWWTLGFEVVNVAILIWLLARFFWRPVAGIIEQRRAAAAAVLDDAAKAKAEADAALAEAQKARAGVQTEHDALIAAARKEADETRASLLDAARKEAASVKAAAEASIQAREAAVRKAWTERSSRLAVDIAGRLVQRLDQKAVREAFQDWLVAAIEGLPEKTKTTVSQEGDALEVVSASDLSPAEQDHVRDTISKAFGATLPVSFRKDATLIAGLELNGAHVSVANSWRADLERIEAELNREQ